MDRLKKWSKKWSKNGSKMGHFGVPPGGSKMTKTGKPGNLYVADIPFLSSFVTFFGHFLVILQYFAQVATCGFWPKIDRKKLIKTADFRRLTFSGFSKSGPKNGSFFGHFWTKNGSKNGPLFWPFFGSFFGPFLDPFLDRFWTTLGSLYLCMSYSRRHLPAYVGGT